MRFYVVSKRQIAEWQSSCKYPESSVFISESELSQYGEPEKIKQEIADYGSYVWNWKIE